MSDDELPPLTHDQIVLAEQRAGIMRHAGSRPRDECEFCCNTCGFRNTLKFDADEMALLDQDVTQYRGPCPKCQRMTLIPAEAMIGDAMNLNDMAEKRLERQVRVAVDAGMNRIEEKIGQMMVGKTTTSAESDATERSDLPDAADVDLDGDVRNG